MLASPARAARLLISLALLNLGLVTAVVAVAAPRGMPQPGGSANPGLSAPTQEPVGDVPPALSTPTVIPLPTSPETPRPTAAPTDRPTATPAPAKTPRPSDAAGSPAPQTDTEP